MSDRPPPADPPWWKQGWGIGYLVMVGFAVLFVFLAAASTDPAPGGPRPRAMTNRELEVGLAVFWLFILLEVGIGVAIRNRDYWRVPKSRNLDQLVTLGLFLLCSAAVIGLCSFTCAVTGAQ